MTDAREDARAGDPVRAPLSDQAWFWAEDRQAKEHQADEDIAAGRVRRFNTDEEFLTALRDP